SSIVYDFELLLDGNKLTRFDGHVRVALPYQLAPNENPSQVVIYYLDELGVLKVIKNGRYNFTTGMVEFTPQHFSYYMAKHVTVAFRDMDKYRWASEAVYGLAAREVVQGRRSGEFVPEGEVTR